MSTPSHTVRWVSTLIGLAVVLQRFAVPGTQIALLLPVFALWVGLALLHGVVVLDRRRTALFCLAAVGTGTVILFQAVWVPDRYLSLPSWALVLATSFPFVCSLADRRAETFVRALHHVVGWGLALAAGCLLMTLTQVAGLAWTDLVAGVVPSSFLLTDFSISYPYSYGSELYRANAWLGLEPSFVSFQLGAAVLAAVLLRRSLRTVGVLGAGLLSTAAGSGLLVVVVGLLVLVGWPRRRVLLRYAVPAAVGVGALAASPFGLSLLARVGEITSSGSSASLRAVEPYALLWAPWTSDAATTLLGAGPGSSQELASATGVLGLLIPTPAKVFFDYGLVGGALLAAFLVLCYTSAPSRSLAASLFLSLWFIQPGLTTTVLVIEVVALVSLWAPQRGLRIEEIRPRRRARADGRGYVSPAGSPLGAPREPEPTPLPRRTGPVAPARAQPAPAPPGGPAASP